MKKVLIFLILFCFTLYTSANSQHYKDEIMAAEVAFAKMATEQGLPKAFLFYAADDAVLKRGENLFKGTKEIAQYFKEHLGVYEKFVWYPDFIDVSISGDLGYTYGKYELAYLNKEGKLIEGSGYFHTVWKRQSDGQWRFVWD